MKLNNMPPVLVLFKWRSWTWKD